MISLISMLQNFSKNHISKLNNKTSFIKEEIIKGKILIHCAAGLSRSPTFAISYLMRENKWTFEDSYNFVKKKKPSIKINYGFLDQLREYENEVKK